MSESRSEPPSDEPDSRRRGRQPESGTTDDNSRAKSDDPLRSSRTSGTWLAVVSAGVLLVLLIIFIAQNTRDVHVSFLSFDGRTPLAVALLIAAAAGLLIATITGTLRIWQLRRRVRRTG